MNPFVHLLNYRAIVCAGLDCKYAVLPIHIDSYLDSLRYNYNKEH